MTVGEVADERPRDVGDEDLAALGLGGDTGGEIDRAAEVAVVLGDDVTGVDAHAHADRMLGERTLDRAGAQHRLARAGEGEHERVALLLDLGAVMALEQVADERVVVAEEQACPLLTQTLQHLRRALDVREDDRHRAGGPGARVDDLAGDAARGLGAEDRVAAVHRAHGLGQLLGARVLRQVPVGARAESRDHAFVDEAREHEYLRRRPRLADEPRRLDRRRRSAWTGP